MKSADIVKALTRDGWLLERGTGSHHHFHHARKQGIVTVPHPKKGHSAWNASQHRKTIRFEIEVGP